MKNGRNSSNLPPPFLTNTKERGQFFPQHQWPSFPSFAHPLSMLAHLSNHIDTRKLVDVFRNGATRKAVGYSGWMGHRGQPDRLKLNRQNCTVFRIFFVLLQKVLWRYCRSNYGEKSLILFHNCTTKRKATGYQYRLYKKRWNNENFL